jgi:hypothetical protein
MAILKSLLFRDGALIYLRPLYIIAKVISEQGAKVTFTQQSPPYLLPGEDIEEDIAFCHLNH